MHTNIESSPLQERLRPCKCEMSIKSNQMQYGRMHIEIQKVFVFFVTRFCTDRQMDRWIDRNLRPKKEHIYSKVQFVQFQMQITLSLNFLCYPRLRCYNSARALPGSGCLWVCVCVCAMLVKTNPILWVLVVMLVVAAAADDEQVPFNKMALKVSNY